MMEVYKHIAAGRESDVCMYVCIGNMKGGEREPTLK